MLLLVRNFPITPNKGNKYIYVMYEYDCNAILTTGTKNRSDKKMIRYFTQLKTALKRREINPGLHYMDNEESEALKMEMKTMVINHLLVTPSNHRDNSSEIIKNVQETLQSGTMQLR